MDVERKREFIRMTPEEIITYKFAATINDTKARYKFIKGPLKLQLVLETIELDNYNHKYGDKKKTKNRKQKKHRRIVHRTETKSSTQNQHGRKKKRKKWTRENKMLETDTSAQNPTGRRSTHAQHGRHNAIPVKGRDTLPRYANQEP